jgi:hypothetical protein
MSGTMAAGETAPVVAPVVAPDATLVVAFGCEGKGMIHLVVDGIARDAACLASNVMEFVPTATGPSRLGITPDHAVRLNLEFRSYTREQAGAALDVPSAELGTVTRSSAAPGFTTCLTSWRLPDGTTGDEGCGPTWRPIPDGRAIRVTAGETLETGITDGWAITGIEPSYADHAALTADATLADWVPLPPVDGPGVEGRFTLGVPPPGDWAIRLAVTGRLADGTTFTADQAFRVIVKP